MGAPSGLSRLRLRLFKSNKQNITAQGARKKALGDILAQQIYLVLRMASEIQKFRLPTDPNHLYILTVPSR